LSDLRKLLIGAGEGNHNTNGMVGLSLLGLRIKVIRFRADHVEDWNRIEDEELKGLRTAWFMLCCKGIVPAGR